MNLIRRLFPFRTCTIDIKEGQRALPRPCLLYHIKRCQGPCIEAIAKDDYRADIEQVMLFLEGRQEQVARALRGRWPSPRSASTTSARPTCATRCKAIERTMESQKMAAFAQAELDVLGFARSGGEAAVQLFAIRDGKTVGRDVFLLENVGDGAGRGGAVARSSSSTTRRPASIPPRVLVPRMPADVGRADAFLEAAAAAGSR